MSKNTITSLMITFVVISFIHAGYSQVRYGVRGGLSFVNFSEDMGGTEMMDFEGVPIEIVIDQSSRKVFNIGGLVEFRLSPIFSLQVNALYNQKGAKLGGNFNMVLVEQGIPVSISGSVEDEIDLTYLSFPVLGKLEFGESDIKPYIIAGPEFGFLLSATDHAKATAKGEAMGMTVGPFTAEEENDIKESFDTFELAINLGAGLVMPLGGVDLFVDGQYSFGLTKINKESTAGSEDIKNQVIMIDVGLLFGGK